MLFSVCYIGVVYFVCWLCMCWGCFSFWLVGWCVIVVWMVVVLLGWLLVLVWLVFYLILEYCVVIVCVVVVWNVWCVVGFLCGWCLVVGSVVCVVGFFGWCKVVLWCWLVVCVGWSWFWSGWGCGMRCVLFGWFVVVGVWWVGCFFRICRCSLVDFVVNWLCWIGSVVVDCGIVYWVWFCLCLVVVVGGVWIVCVV